MRRGLGLDMLPVAPTNEVSGVLVDGVGGGGVVAEAAECKGVCMSGTYGTASAGGIAFLVRRVFAR